MTDEIVACAQDSQFLKRVVTFDGTANFDAELDRIALDKPVRFDRRAKPGATTWRCSASPRAPRASQRRRCTFTAIC